METFKYDELQIYRGDDLCVNKYLSIKQATLGEICDYGEFQYLSLVRLFTSTPADMMWQLDDQGVDYTEISEWELFCDYLYKAFKPEYSSILFGEFDFSKLKKYTDEATGEISLAMQSYNGESIIFDYATYLYATDYLRKVHNLRKNEDNPFNEETKRILIEEARENALYQKNEKQKSVFKNLISAMVNSSGFKYDWQSIWNMKINAFMDSVSRIQKIKNSELLLQSGYSGFGIDLSKLKNKEKQLDWMGEL